MATVQHIQAMHQTFFDFWNAHRALEGRVCDRLIDPKLLKSVLPNLVKIRLRDSEPKFSIVGTNIVEEYQTDFTGKLVREHPYPICREIYLSLLKHMDAEPGYKLCYGYFCYSERHYLRTMEAAFPLGSETGETSGYLVLVTVNHDTYKEKLYQPNMPENATTKYADIATQKEFDEAMKRYQQLSL